MDLALGGDRARSPGDAQIEELILRCPGVKHGAFVDLFGARIVGEEHGGDVVGFAGVGESEERARAGDMRWRWSWLSAVWLIFLAKV